MCHYPNHRKPDNLSGLRLLCGEDTAQSQKNWVFGTIFSGLRLLRGGVLPNHRRLCNFFGLHMAESQREPGNSLGGVSSVAEILPNYRKNQVISLDCICSVVEILPNHRKNWVISLDCVCSMAEILPNHRKNWVISLNFVCSVAEILPNH